MKVVLDMEWLAARTLVNCLRAPTEHGFSVPGCGCGSEQWMAGSAEGCSVHDVRGRYNELADAIMAAIGEEEP